MEVRFKNLENENISYFYVIEADVYGVRKYVSKNFPDIFQYSKKITGAKRFSCEESATKFIDTFKDKIYSIQDPIIKKVKRIFVIEE